jgi:hypothetical protein
MQSIE